jgi:hypothetical protein
MGTDSELVPQGGVLRRAARRQRQERVPERRRSAMPPATAPTPIRAKPAADRPAFAAVELVSSPACTLAELGVAVTTRRLAVAELPSLQSMAGSNVPGRMLPGSVTVTVNTPPPDGWLFRRICAGRPSVVPDSVADVAWGLPHVTWSVIAVPAVTVDGVATATAAPRRTDVAASAGPDRETSTTPRASAAEAARLVVSARAGADRLIRRANVPPRRRTGGRCKINDSPVVRCLNTRCPDGQTNATRPGMARSAPCCAG